MLRVLRRPSRFARQLKTIQERIKDIDDLQALKDNPYELPEIDVEKDHPEYFDNRDLWTITKRRKKFIANSYGVDTIVESFPVLNHHYKGLDIFLLGTPEELGGGADILEQTIKEFEGNTFVLGNLGVEDLEHLEEKSGHEVNPHDPDNVAARTRLMSFMRKTLLDSNALITHPSAESLAWIDHRSNEYIPDGGFSCAYAALCKRNAQIMFAKAPEFLLLEHLALNYSAEELANMLTIALKDYHDALNSSIHGIRDTRGKLMRGFQEVVKSSFSEELFSKQADFTFAMIESLTNVTNKSVCVTIEKNLIENLAVKM